MPSRWSRVIVPAAIAIALGFGCSKTTPQPYPAPAPPAPPSPAEPGPPPAGAVPDDPPPPSTSLSDEALFAQKSLEQLNAERPLGDALFDVNQSTIRDDARAVLQRNAEWLRRWSSTRVRIEGHGDERGTSEYNLALGQRRGAAIRDYLVDLGVAPDRITVTSKGEEAPVCAEQTEGCWQQNRRGHPVITAK